MNDLIHFREIADERGALVSLEQQKNIPFPIKRVYYIYNTADAPRGFHAHKNLQQVLVCLHGSCDVLLDNGKEKKTVTLDHPSKGLFVDKMVWHEMSHFSDGCVLMVLASDYYDEEDYIRDYENFTRRMDQGQNISFFAHDQAIVESKEIGEKTTIWAFAHVLPGAKIGTNCNLNDHTFVENDVVIGDNVTVKSGVHLWDGIRIEDNVFIGPSVVFTNDLNPRSKQYPEKFASTILKKGASIGANSTIIAGNTIGEFALIGAGSVVTKDVPPYTLWYGNPAQQKGFVCECGQVLKEMICFSCQKDLSTVLQKEGDEQK